VAPERAGSTVSSSTAGSHPTFAWFDLALAVLVALAVRGNAILSASFPLNDGGLFAAMVGDLVHNSLALPAITSYNGAGIPFVYPPLALELAAWLSSTFHIGVIDLLRFIPLIASVLTVALVWLLVRELLPGRWTPLIAGLAYALTPRAYDWLVMGGGLTRSIGMLLALVAIWQWVIAVRGQSLMATILAGVASGLTALAHPQAAIFAAASVLLMWAFLGRSREGAMRLGAVVAIASGLVIPWLLLLAVAGNLGHLLGASGLGAQPLTGLVWMLGLDWTDAAHFDIVIVLGVVGLVVAIARREWLLPTWLGLSFLVDARGGATAATVPLALLVAVGVESGLWPMLKPHRRTAAVLGAVGLLLAVFGTSQVQLEGAWPLRSLAPDSRALMAWTAGNLPPETRVLVATDAPWWADAPSEWFPVLAGGVSVANVQGTEWLGGSAFATTQSNHSHLEDCAAAGPSCALDWLRSSGASADYLFIPADCCAGFRSLALVDPRFAAGHQVGNSVILRIKAGAR